MPRLELTFACCRYDRTEALREGAIPIEGIDLNCITLRSGREIFDRMAGGHEFDVAELSASEFIGLAGRGDWKLSQAGIRSDLRAAGPRKSIPSCP